MKSKTIAKNSLYYKNKKLIKEWHPVKNGSLTPKDVTYGSRKKVWWKCKKGHEWQAEVTKRHRGGGCPYCSNHRVCKDNCLATTNPALAKEWHPVKNGSLTPKDVTYGSEKKVWWKCKKGHEWQALILNRRNGLGCPYCSNHRVCKDNCLATVKPALAKEWHPVKNGRLTPEDVTYGSEKKVWWKCKKGHEWQTEVSKRYRGGGCPYCSNQRVCKDNCLATVHPALAKEWHPVKNGSVTPKDVTWGSGKKVWWKCRKGHEWQAVVSDRYNGARCPFCSNRRACKDNCLATTHPELAKEWHPVKNGSVTPEDVTCGSNKKAWWKCKKGHEWQAIIAGRQKGYGCPYCSGLLACKDNCLATLNPGLAKEWHPVKNGSLTPEDVTCGSNKKVCWKCKKGHKWKTSVNSRNNGGCPYCSGRRVCKDNCLATLNPALSKEWHPVKNGSLTPEDVTCGSIKNVWWKCKKKGHEWQARIAARHKGLGCPYCSNHRVCEDNCLATTHPALAKEWHPVKNKELTPHDVVAGSIKKVWWKCFYGHEWQSTIVNRKKGRGCPGCFKMLRDQGFYSESRTRHLK